MRWVVLFLAGFAMCLGCSREDIAARKEKKEKAVVAPLVKKEILGKVQRTVQGILDAKGDVNQYVTSDGRIAGDGITLLGWAVSHWDLPQVTLLLGRGAKVDAGPKARASWTPLFDAINGFQLTEPADRKARLATSQKIIGALVRAKANVNHATKTKETPLHRAAKQGRGDVCTFLIRSGAKPDTPDGLRQTALHHAAKHGYHAAVAALLQSGANPGLQDLRGMTPLQLAENRPEERDQNDIREAMSTAYSDADYDKTIALLGGK